METASDKELARRLLDLRKSTSIKRVQALVRADSAILVFLKLGMHLMDENKFPEIIKDELLELI